MNISDKQRKFITEDLAGYELRQLLGATQLVKLFDEKDMGNACSILRDSIYLHARNLYNFFHGVSRNDASIYEFTNHVFDVSLYIKWKSALHNHVLHIKDTRVRPNNEIDGIHINTVVQDFATDIERLWQNWICTTSDSGLKEVLKKGLEQARENANNDYKNTRSRLLEKER